MPNGNTQIQNSVLVAVNGAGEQFKARLNSTLDSEKFKYGVLTAVQKNPMLLQCDPRSVLLAAYEAAELGVDLSPSMQLGFIIPYGKQAQFQPSYRAYIQKAYATKAVRLFFADVVYEHDRFEIQAAPSRTLNHLPALSERGDPIGAYAFVEFVDGHRDYEWMTKEQILRRRDHSRQKDSLMWTKFWEEGWRKTPIRVLAKRMPIIYPGLDELARLANHDSAAEVPDPIVRGAIERESGDDSQLLTAAEQADFNQAVAGDEPETVVADAGSLWPKNANNDD